MATMYVESDFLVALVKDDDWLQERALQGLENESEIHTSILAYAEVLVLFCDRERAEYEIDAPRAVSNLLEVVPVEPAHHEEAILAAAALLEEYDLTPFDALHAGLATTRGESVLSSEGMYDDVGLDRVALDEY